MAYKDFTEMAVWQLNKVISRAASGKDLWERVKIF